MLITDRDVFNLDRKGQKVTDFPHSQRFALTLQKKYNVTITLVMAAFHSGVPVPGLYGTMNAI